MRSLDSNPFKTVSKFNTRMQQSENVIRLGNKLPPVDPYSKQTAKQMRNHRLKQSRQNRKPEEEPFILLDYHKPVQFTGNPFNKEDLYFNPFKNKEA
jgi:hypothetical protein